MRRKLVFVTLGLLLLAGGAGWFYARSLLQRERRDAVPHALASTARIPGYGDIRFWGDKRTPDFETFVTSLYQTIKRNAASGVKPDFSQVAKFIAISGGGYQGAFTAGMMRGWSERGDRPVFETVTGVSTGALAAPFVFLGSSHDRDLEDIYLTHTEKDLYTSRGVLGFFGNSLNSTAPLETLIRGYATEAFLDEIGRQQALGRRLLVATTDLDAQRPMIWDLTAIAASKNPDRRDLFVKILLASAAIPGVFPPVTFPVVTTDGKTYEELHVDGGATAEVIFVPPEARLNDFENEVFGHRRDRSLYVIRNGKLVPEYEASKDNVLALSARGVATLIKYQVLANLQRLSHQAETGHAQFYFEAIPPAFDAVSPHPFDLVYAKLLYDCGRQVGLTASWSTKVPPTPIMTPHDPASKEMPVASADAVRKACTD